MRIARGVIALAAVGVLAAACSGTAATPSPTVAPTTAPSSSASAEPSASPDACAPDQVALKTPGTLTIGADNPAYPPYFQPSREATPPWEFGDPTNGNGFEATVAWLVAKYLGFTRDTVTWIPVTFNNATQPGPKDFDFYITQVSYTPERAQAVDFSKGYYFVNQSVVALKNNPIAAATSIADLKPYVFAAQTGTTSFTTIDEVIQPDKEPLLFDTNDAAIEAVKNGQADALVVDLPTAYFIRDFPQIENSVIVGQFEAPPGGEYFALVLDKGSALTPCVNAALEKMRASGDLDAAQQRWLGGGVGNAPIFTP